MPAGCTSSDDANAEKYVSFEDSRFAGINVAAQGESLPFFPEVFIQLTGYTDFKFPKESMRLEPGEICVIGIGVPHRETASPWRNKAFRNLVIMFSASSISWHLAQAGEDGVPRGCDPHHVSTREAGRLTNYLSDLIDVYHSHASFRDIAVQGLMQTFLASLLGMMEGSYSSRSSRELFKITQCRDYVIRNMANPLLNVKMVAQRMQCSPNYLSSLFCGETGTTLTSFIQRERIIQARHLLETTSFNVGETAVAVGYEDPVYFTRVFKRHTGQTPKKYQNCHKSR